MIIDIEQSGENKKYNFPRNLPHTEHHSSTNITTFHQSFRKRPTPLILLKKYICIKRTETKLKMLENNSIVIGATQLSVSTQQNEHASMNGIIFIIIFRLFNLNHIQSINGAVPAGAHQPHSTSEHGPGAQCDEWDGDAETAKINCYSKLF